MEQVEIEDQLSSANITMEDNIIMTEESSTSFNPPMMFTDQEGFIKLEEECFDHTLVKKTFLVGMGSLAKDTEVLSIHKNLSTSIKGQARLKSFRVNTQAIAMKCGGSAIIKHAWYGASKDEISEITSHGFSRVKRHANCEYHGIGIHLFPAKFSIQGALSAVEDENGLRHVLLCRVILGRTEVVDAGSKQLHPSSEDFESGVDDLLEPRRYIVWSAFMNAHILPIYILSFRSHCLQDFKGTHGNISKAIFPWVTFVTLLSVLERFLPPSTMKLISKCHTDFHKHRLTRQQLMQRVRQLAGDNLLMLAIKCI